MCAICVPFRLPSLVRQVRVHVQFFDNLTRVVSNRLDESRRDKPMCQSKCELTFITKYVQCCWVFQPSIVDRLTSRYISTFACLYLPIGIIPQYVLEHAANTMIFPDDVPIRANYPSSRLVWAMVVLLRICSSHCSLPSCRRTTAETGVDGKWK